MRWGQPWGERWGAELQIDSDTTSGATVSDSDFRIEFTITADSPPVTGLYARVNGGPEESLPTSQRYYDAALSSGSNTIGIRATDGINEANLSRLIVLVANEDGRGQSTGQGLANMLPRSIRTAR